MTVFNFFLLLSTQYIVHADEQYKQALIIVLTVKIIPLVKQNLI
jgi:hypothetical protein